MMNANFTVNEIDWSPILNQIQRVDDQSLPTYTGDLKAALLNHAGLSSHPKAGTVYQLASDIARLTTHCDPEIVYWFSRLLSLLETEVKHRRSSPYGCSKFSTHCHQRLSGK